MVTLGPSNRIHPRDYSQISSSLEFFHILILCDGFTSAREFQQYCRRLTHQLFEIPPFDSCKDYITIWALYTPDGFGTSYDDYNAPNWDSTGKEAVIAKVTQIDFTYCATHFSGAEVWLNKQSKSYGAVGIATTNRGIAGNTLMEDPPNFFGFCGYHSGFVGHVFAHELGHTIRGYAEQPDGSLGVEKVGLENEYELFAVEYRGPEPVNPNVTAFQTVEADLQLGSINVDKLKWRRLFASQDLANLRQHTSNKLLFKLDRMAQYDTNDYINSPYITDVMVVEGGKDVAYKIFRPNLACKMRNATITVGSAHAAGPPFCKVCKAHIQRSITGSYGCRLGSSDPLGIHNFLIEQRLMDILISSLRADFSLFSYAEYLPLSPVAAVRMAVMLCETAGIDMSSLSFVIGANGHTSLRHNHIIIAPMLFQLYHNSQGAYTYALDRFHETLIHVQEDAIPNVNVNNDLSTWVFSKSFVGDFHKLSSYISKYGCLNLPNPHSDSNLFSLQLRRLFIEQAYSIDPATGMLLGNLPLNIQPTANIIQEELLKYRTYERAPGSSPFASIYGRININPNRNIFPPVQP